jgi:SAM-dependent methyltransferase
LSKPEFRPNGPDWKNRAKLNGLQPVLDPYDQRAKSNAYIDTIHKKTLQKHRSLVDGNLILDFGCGVGRLSKWLASQANNVVGVEITKEMLARANSESSLRESYILYDGANLCFKRASFDFVISVWVLQIIYPRFPELFATIIKQISYCIKDNGHLLLIEQLPRDYSPQLLFAELRKAGFKRITSYPLPTRSTCFHFLANLLPLMFLNSLSSVSVMLSKKRMLPKFCLGKKYVDYVMVFAKAESNSN